MTDLKELEKRDGRSVVFDKEKIANAMYKAYESVEEIKVKEGKELSSEEELTAFLNFSQDTADSIEKKIYKETKKYTVEEIQDIVEQRLMASKYKDIAREYIVYREKRNQVRNSKSKLNQTIMQKLSAKSVQNQNANVDEKSFGGRVGEASDAMMKEIALNQCVSKKARARHLNNEIYIHDLASYPIGSHNCLTCPIDDLLARGFNTRQTDVRPANSINTAMQLVAVLFQLQSLQQFGGVSASHLDWSMVPYVRKSFTKHFIDGLRYVERLSDYKIQRMKKWLTYDNHMDGLVHFEDTETKELHELAWEYAMDKTEQETEQAVEGLYHNLNTLQSRSGNQLPFSSINYGTCTIPEGRMITKALLEVSIEGIGKLHKTSIFPCGIFQSMKGVNQKKGDPNYDLFKLALKSTAKRLYPNYANVDWSGNEGYDPKDPRTYFSTMGCRTANGWDINGFGQLKDGRGNICPVTIIMPTYAMQAKERVNKRVDGQELDNLAKEQLYIDEFMKLLDKAIADARDMLLERFEWICSQSPDSARFMYENNVMAGYRPEEGIRSALKHGTLAIGNLALAETLQILMGCDHTDEHGMVIAKKIYKLFKDRCAEYKEEYKLNFGVYNTPAENLCYTAMTKFKEKYGIIENVSDKDFFTNSMHVPVWKELNPFEKIDLESQLTGYSSAGCITYVELDGGVTHNLDALEQIVLYAMKKDIPYFAVNVPSDTCLDCGFTGEINCNCPKCNSNNVQYLRRVTGYITGNYKTAFNMGKQQEVSLRFKHSKKLASWND